MCVWFCFGVCIGADTAHLCTSLQQHNMARRHFHSVIAALSQSAKMQQEHPPPPKKKTHTQRHTNTLNSVVKSQQKIIKSRGSGRAGISLKIHSCKILLFKPPSPLFNSLIHLSLDCKTKHALSSCFLAGVFVPACTPQLMCVPFLSLPSTRGMSLACPTCVLPPSPPSNALGGLYSAPLRPIASPGA